MSKFGLLLSLPHTGTHKLISFINDFYNEARRLGVGETGNRLLESAIQGHISVSQLIDCLKWFRLEYPDRPQVEESGVRALLLQNEVATAAKIYDEKYKWLFYYSHLLDTNHQGKYWPQDLLDRDLIRCTTIAPLRDPILTSISAILLTGDRDIDYSNFSAPDFKGITFYIQLTIDGFKKLVGYKKLLGKDMHFLPVDLYIHLSPEDRVSRANAFVSDLGLTQRGDKGWVDSIKLWNRANPSTHDPGGLFNDHAEMNRYMCMKKELEAGHHLPYSNELVDYLIDTYRNMPGLQELFEANGYSDLSWFR